MGLSRLGFYGADCGMAGDFKREGIMWWRHESMQLHRDISALFR